MRRIPLLVFPCLLPGCLWSAHQGRDRYLAEVARDVEKAPLDDAGSLRRGRALEAEASELAERQDLGLVDCFRLAVVESQRLRIGGERVFQADTLQAEAIGALLPSVTAHGAYTRDSDVVEFGGFQFTPQERYEFWFSARQRLVDLRAFAAVELAKQIRKIESLTLRDSRDKLLFQVATVFYATLSFEEDVEALESAKKRSAEQVRVLEVGLRAGEVEKQELLLTQARLAETDAQLVQARYDVSRSRARLARLTGIGPFDRQLVDRLEVESTPGEIPHLVDRALSDRLDLEAARARIEQAVSERNLALAGYAPTLNVDFDHWTKMRGGFTELIDWTVTVNLEWNLFDGGQREAQVARALSLVRERQLEEESLAKDIREEVEEAVLAFQSLDRSLDALEKRSAAATESEERTSRQFGAGAVTNLDVLVAQAARETAERDLARTRFARKLAALRIRLAVGDLRTALREDIP